MKDETKEKASKLWSDIKSGLKIGFDATKKGLSKAGTAIQNYSDLGVVQIEKKQFESKAKKVYALLGEIVAQKLTAKGAASIKASDEGVADLLKELADIKKEIAKRDKILKEAEKEAGAAASKTGAKKAAPKKAPAKKASTKKSAE